MGIIVGFLATALAACALVTAWPLGWLMGGYRRAAVLLAVMLGLAGAGVAYLEPINQSRPESAIWPIGVAGGGALVIILLAYAWLFGWLWRAVRRRISGGEGS